MNTKWLKGYTNPEELESRRKEVRSYKNAYDALRELLERQGEEAKPDYDNPSWSHAQADVNGANRKLREIIDLINIKD